MSPAHRLSEIERAAWRSLWMIDSVVMLSKKDAEQILEDMRARPPYALNPLKAQEIEALILLEIDSLVNDDDREALRCEGVIWEVREEPC